MTLIITVGNKRGVYQTSDYKLTANGKHIEDTAGTKQIEANFKEYTIAMAFTGIAYGGGQKVKTIDFLTKTIRSLPLNSKLEDICNRLVDQCESIVPSNQSLTLVLSVSSNDKPFQVVVISNTDWYKKPPRISRAFEIKIYIVKKPFVNIEGYRNCVSKLSQKRLIALSKNTNTSHDQILATMVDINSDSAKFSQGIVSEKCWATAQFLDGTVRRSISKNVGGEGMVTGILGGFDIAEWAKQNLKPAAGQKLTLHSVSGISGQGTPTPAPFGPPKQFLISREKITAVITAPDTSKLAEISISDFQNSVTVRCNDEVRFMFGEIELTPLASNMSNFKSYLPYPFISPVVKINGANTPQEWEQSINCFVENAVCHVQCLSTSRGIINTEYLELDEEIIIVTPIDAILFAFTSPGSSVKKNLDGRFIWRKRIDGTRG
jgi:hypothetical protein